MRALTDSEAEATFVSLVELLDGLGCAPVVTVASKEDRGVSFSLHFSADRARKLSASVDRSPEGGDHEDGRHAKHESAVAACCGETPTPGPAIDQDGGEA